MDLMNIRIGWFMRYIAFPSVSFLLPQNTESCISIYNQKRLTLNPLCPQKDLANSFRDSILIKSCECSKLVLLRRSPVNFVFISEVGFKCRFYLYE